MKINLLAFGIAKDIFGKREIDFQISEQMSISRLKNHLVSEYPDFAALAKFDIAVNQEYQTDDYVVKAGDEVAIIPPVSGG